ncbi:flagellar protein FliO/FliZ [Thiogranum longum]|uniref:Flagellar protein n=1 Tax=Thiogranum longum TaxID=1537524 RepID=A0A4R1HET0_9GAMM|nr:flagellar biosynthetic protein FliO [Thiogranum longum]TCK18835.1 flagellar protein FliO/FliZ [Thiogranum longum]
MFQTMQCRVLVFAGMLVTASAHAVEEAGNPSSPASGANPMAVSNLWQLTLGMVAVLALMLGLAWILKRTGKFQMAAGGSLKILGGLSMGTRERVVLLQVGDTQLLVGVAPGRVQTLHVLDQPLDAQDQPAGGGFADQLGRMMGKAGSK